MQLFTTLSRSVELITPITTPKIGLYACGFTVYDYTHLGHLRKYTMDDILVRTLRHAGFEVTFVQNVTDVGHLSSDADTGEDKLEKGAKKYGKSVWDVAREFEDYFFKSMDSMGNLRPDVSCRATEHIVEQLEMVKTLEQKGFAYVIAGDGVYFDTSKDADYGKLAQLDVSKQKEGARVDRVEGKRNPSDFALWKFERPGENRAMVWPSPWAERSFPGWHIECSAMAMKYLGQQFEIHTGGIDHIPVHHTNEIAQAESATGKVPFVKYWVHHNFLRINGEKMSKSLGNFFTIDAVVEKGFSTQALRLLFASAHYRSELNFTWENLAGAQTAWEKLATLFLELKQELGDSKEELQSELAHEYAKRFFDHMENDLQTSEAMATLWAVLKDPALSRLDKYALLQDFDVVLAFGLDKLTRGKAAAIPDSVQKLLDARLAAREAQDWVRADHLRLEISKLGFTVGDESGGKQSIKKSTA